MILGEPPRTGYDLSFRFFSIPVRVHPYFWLLSVLLIARPLLSETNARDFLALLLPWTAAVFVGIVVHELGHAVAMRFYGRRPWITLYALGGITSSGEDGSYGSKTNATLREVLISVAGPMAGFLLAAMVVLVLWSTGHGVVFRLELPYGLSIDTAPVGTRLLTRFIDDLLTVSVYWGVLNLLPIYPLDGGQIAREIFLKLNRREGIARSLMLSVVTAGALAAIGLLVWQDLFIAILFGYMAYTSYATLEAYRRRW
ncbi:MAG: site-2 protease family protein [Pirellulales bacterium]|nr:site-2 protease family protein [Pirellulales bacterium]